MSITEEKIAGELPPEGHPDHPLRVLDRTLEFLLQGDLEDAKAAIRGARRELGTQPPAPGHPVCSPEGRGCPAIYPMAMSRSRQGRKAAEPTAHGPR